MKKTILFVILEQYADWEAAYLSSAIYRFGQGNYEVKTVSLRKEPVHSMGGFQALPDYDFGSIPENYEALILVGGMTWRTEPTDPVKEEVVKSVKAGKLVAAICDATVFLGTTGALNNVAHTSNVLEQLKGFAGSRYTGESKYKREQVVRDQNIITANGTASLEFAKEVLLALKIAPEEDIMHWFKVYKLGYYDAIKEE